MKSKRVKDEGRKWEVKQKWVMANTELFSHSRLFIVALLFFSFRPGTEI